MKSIITFFLFLSFALQTKSQTVWMEETKLIGHVGKYEIVMKLAIPYGGANNCFVIGEYFYTSQKKPIALCAEEENKIYESVNNKYTGYFVIHNWNKKIGQMVYGSWHSMDGKRSYPVKLKVFGKGNN